MSPVLMELNTDSSAHYVRPLGLAPVNFSNFLNFCTFSLQICSLSSHSTHIKMCVLFLHLHISQPMSSHCHLHVSTACLKAPLFCAIFWHALSSSLEPGKHSLLCVSFLTFLSLTYLFLCMPVCKRTNSMKQLCVIPLNILNT